MKNKLAWLSAWMFIGCLTVEAQQKTSLNITEAIKLATTQSKEAKATDTKIAGKELELGVAKTKVLPDFKISGMYNYISTPNVDLKIPLGSSSSEGSGGGSIETNQMYLGMANASMPIYAGGKIKNGIKISETALEAQKYAALNTKDQLAEQTVQLYVALYKAQQTVVLMEENVKRSQQQVIDFRAMEENGIIARNDLLKAELQLSNYQLALQEAKKNVSVVNYQLVTFLQLEPNTIIENVSFDGVVLNEIDTDVAHAFETRNDVKVVQAQHDIAQKQVEISKADYLPTVAATAGYNAFGLQNIVTVSNAMTVGVSVSYDLGSLYKNNKHVKAAKNKVEESEEQLAILNDRVGVQIYQANQNFELAKKQQTVYEQALVQAEENYRIVKDKYENGVADTDDLLEAEVQQAQSQINIAISKANIIEKYYDLLLVNGQLTTTYSN